MLATIGCAAPRGDAAVITESERIVGRARLDGSVALLTTAPAIVLIDPRSERVSRFPLRASEGITQKLWGLGEIDGALYSVSGLSALVRIAPGGSEASVSEVARPRRALGNLIDTAAGMAAQFAIDDRGEPIAWTIDGRGVLSRMPGPPRAPLGLLRAEESVLHLMACSPPPHAVCWTPGSNQLLTFNGNQLQQLAPLEAARRILPSAVLSAPEARAIRDALWVDEGVLVVLFEGDGPGKRLVLGEFDMDGRLLRELAPSTPVRVLVGARAKSILAIARSGALIEVPR